MRHAFKLPRYGVLGTRRGGGRGMPQTRNRLSRRPWNV